MFTSLLTSICHFASGFLSGFGLQSAAGAIASAGTGELVAAGAGVFILSKYFGKLLSFVVKWFVVFVIGMMLYRHVSWFQNITNAVCHFMDSYLPSAIANIQSMIK